MAKGKSTEVVALPRWSDAEVRADCERSLEHFVDEWIGDAPARRVAFARLQHECAAKVDELMQATTDLSDLSVRSLAAEAHLEALRFMTGPFVSEDDLRTLARLRGPRARGTEEFRRVVDVLRPALDGLRLPWLDGGRRARDDERRAAVAATAAVWATERFRTERRGSVSTRQEHAVTDVLASGLVRDAAWSGPAGLLPGHFVAFGVELAGTRCDRLARLHDTRLLAVECKVSNSSVNSYKRLNNDTVAKAEKWRKEFGNQCIAVAVLAGVFRPENVLAAQENHGVAIVWAHDLEPIATFVEEVRERG